MRYLSVRHLGKFLGFSGDAIGGRIEAHGCGSMLQRRPAEIGAGESERSKFRSLSRAARFPNLESCSMASESVDAFLISERDKQERSVAPSVANANETVPSPSQLEQVNLTMEWLRESARLRAILSQEGLERVIHAAELCFGCATAMLDYAAPDSYPRVNDAHFSAYEGLFEGAWALDRYLFPSQSPYNQLLCLASESHDRNADYGIGISAAHCHAIAWMYGKSLLEVLNRRNVVMATLDGKSAVCRRTFRETWDEIREAMKPVPRIDYAKFLAALQCEAAHARARLVESDQPTVSRLTTMLATNSRVANPVPEPNDEETPFALPATTASAMVKTNSADDKTGDSGLTIHVDGLASVPDSNQLATPKRKGTQVDDVTETIKRVTLMLGEDGGKIMAIVSHSEFKTDQKLRSLAKLDERFRGYKSKDLAELLGVSQASIRNGNVWKEWNPKPAKRAKSAQM